MDELLVKYKERIREELGLGPLPMPERVISHEYIEFKKNFFPKHLTLYEKACGIAERIVKVRPDAVRAAELEDAIRITHLDVTPTGTLSFAVLVPIIMMVFGTLLAYLVFESLFFVLLLGVGSLVLILPFQKLPDFWANNWRLKSSNQMVQCIFYVVTFMRHTSNLERAIEFTSDHIGPPMSLDLRKILWDVETGTYESIKDSIENYLKTWEKWNREFIEAFHLIESSLYEPSESRRLDSLDKALSVMLSETYEKMLHYAHNLQSPVTMLHMLGVILPILGLVILPLVVSFMTNDTSPGQIALTIGALYNVLLPVSVYFITKVVLSKRPTGYGQTDIGEDERFAKYKNVLLRIGGKEIAITPLFVAGIVFAVFFLIGISPLLIHAFDPSFEIPFGDGNFALLGYICLTGNICAQEAKAGPYGIGAALLSLFVTLSFGVGVGLYYKMRSKNVIGIRDKTKRLEQEFASALFQLGNRLGDNIPAEIAFGQVSNMMKGTTSGDFFAFVHHNITKLGMSIDSAIFDPKNGALAYYPSKIIESSMKVLVEGSKKGPRVAAEALISMSRYIKEIHRVDERLKDLLAEIISSMKGQIKFLTPAIAGIVIGITSMITTILNRLSAQIASFSQQGTDLAAGGGLGNLVSLFGNGVPTYYFQIIVGLYVVQITYILTILSNGIENGADAAQERYLVGTYTFNATLLYVVICFSVMLMFNIIASQILQGIGG
ncbi:MAG TPA: hypothetical protein VJH88_04000 [Candidatus Nanoarchaeia archaeon]|nr:hypothetical protein [Candidatus Nanoarchaeia archaeon]